MHHRFQTIPIILSITAASLAASVSIAHEDLSINVTRISDSEGKCSDSYRSCKIDGYPSACCPENTSCALDTDGKLWCCPHSTICYSTDNPHMAFIEFRSSAARRSKSSWSYAIAAMAFGVGNWRRREW
ncbi:hypothetical protein FN846DRAFT_422282 [Sphaerosporella brunnea]|uniref:Granulins domain-containing protein n=1 Tax=Sphaerosporella brunnea TaxID=1250544 RepID=A0A5J5EHB1_9PEZI|nr:hypothetical protein FN846DRAFT_422282 [Sphaerosporella brunnea]